jgi:hypothetical protein
VNAESRAARTVSRLQAVDWAGDTNLEHLRSRAALMKEYLRRAAWWAQELDASEEWPFIDIAAHVAPGAHVPDDLARQLETLIHDRVGWPSVADTCRNALRWASALDAGAVMPGQLEDPFEPLLLLFERGGGWTEESGFIDLGLASLRRRTWRDHLTSEPATGLAPSTLDALDDASQHVASSPGE